MFELVFSLVFFLNFYFILLDICVYDQYKLFANEATQAIYQSNSADL